MIAIQHIEDASNDNIVQGVKWFSPKPMTYCKIDMKIAQMLVEDLYLAISLSGDLLIEK